jgi:periplasmic divalent cation tolerance protein
MILFYVPVANAEEARSMARTLVREGLVACANLVPIRSIYTWEGELEEEAEVAMILKTREDLAQAVRDRVTELHTYEVPCIAVFTPASVNEAYEAWVEASTRRGDTGP